MLSLPQLRQLNYGHPRLLRWRAAPLWHGMVRPVAKRTPSKLGSSVGMPRTSHDARTHDVVTANSNTHTGGDGNGVGIVHRRGGKDADDGRRDGKTAKRSAIIVDPLEVCISGRLASRTTVTHSLLYTTEAKVPRISCIYNCLGDSRLPRLHSIQCLVCASHPQAWASNVRIPVDTNLNVLMLPCNNTDVHMLYKQRMHA